MSSSPSPVRWASPLLRRLGASPAFARALDEQLSAAARALSGVDLRGGGFTLLVEPDAPPSIETLGDGEQRIDVELLAPDLARPVGIAWRCAGRTTERVAPSSTPSSDCDLRFRWIDFPAEELRRFAGPQPPAEPLGGPYPFSVETWFIAGKDLFVELQRAQPYDRGVIDAVASRLFSPQFAPRARRDLLSPTRLQLAVDLADSGEPATLRRLLQRLASPPDLGLTKVIIRSFPVDAATYEGAQ
jgi:hypothetical protein